MDQRTGKAALPGVGKMLAPNGPAANSMLVVTAELAKRGELERANHSSQILIDLQCGTSSVSRLFTTQ
jgi:hypothetical protein